MNEFTEVEKKSLEWDCNKNYGLIYKGTCGNGKVYIGLTTRKLEAGVKQHIKSGKIGFDWEVIDQAYNSKEELIEKEKYWIKYYDAMNPEHGYNRKNGNAGMSKEAINDLLLTYYSCRSYFSYRTQDSKYDYSLDKDKTGQLYYNQDWQEMDKIHWCLLNEFLYILAKNKRKYKLSNKTLIVDKATLEKICYYVSNKNDELEHAFNDLIPANVLIFCRKRSIINWNDFGIFSGDSKIAFRFHKGLIKKYRVAYDVLFDIEKEVFYE